MSKKNYLLSPPIRLLHVSVVFSLLFVICLALIGCNVTRTVTTTSQYYQKGDTTCTIQTKTIETYDASKK